MFRSLRKNGTVVLPALAWSFVTAAHLDAVSRQSVLVAHVVMVVVFALFVVASRDEMREGVMRVWKYVIVVGGLVTLAAAVTLASASPNPTVLAVTVSAWMVVPAAALLYTGRHVDAAPWVYLVGGGLSGVGWVVYLWWLVSGAASAMLVGLVLVGLGQTAGIVNAVYQY